MLNTSLSNDILQAMFGIKTTVTFPGTTYLGISTKDPGDTGADFDEPDPSTGYARCLIGKTNNTDVQYMALKSGTNRIITNKRMILMDMLTADVGAEGTHYLLFSNPTGGSPYAWGKLKDAITLSADRVVVFKEGNLEIELTDAEAITAVTE